MNLHFSWEEPPSFLIQSILGIPILTISGALTYCIGFNNSLILRAFISLSITLVGMAMLSKSMSLKLSLTDYIKFTIIGWIAVFFMLFYVNPPGTIE